MKKFSKFSKKKRIKGKIFFPKCKSFEGKKTVSSISFVHYNNILKKKNK